VLRDQVQEAGLHLGIRPAGGDRLRQTREAVADRDAHIFDTAVLDLGEHPEPELRTLAAVAGPQPEDVPLAVDSDPDDHVDGPLGTDTPNVAGLVYIAGFGLDEGESIGALLGQGPPTPALAHLDIDQHSFAWIP
jgi:hypothetical protein